MQLVSMGQATLEAKIQELQEEQKANRAALAELQGPVGAAICAEGRTRPEVSGLIGQFRSRHKKQTREKARKHPRRRHRGCLRWKRFGGLVLRRSRS